MTQGNEPCLQYARLLLPHLQAVDVNVQEHVVKILEVHQEKELHDGPNLPHLVLAKFHHLQERWQSLNGEDHEMDVEIEVRLLALIFLPQKRLMLLQAILHKIKWEE